MLDWEVHEEVGWFWATPRAEAGRDIALSFLPVPEEKVVKNRLHIDVSPVGMEQFEELERLRRLGAVSVDVGRGEQSSVVLSDPEGKEFCLLRARRN